MSEAQNAHNVIYDFEVVKNSGEKTTLKDYQGKVLLIVNTASKCGFTGQYNSLQELHEKYSDKGLAVLGFPANDFGNQEPGTNEEIIEFCRTNFNVQFDLFEKISVKGKEQHPLFEYITSLPDYGGPIKWNFTKFLVDKEGNVVARYGSMTNPISKKVTDKIEELLG